MKSLLRHLRLYRIFAVQYLKTTMQSKVDFFIGLGGFLLSQGAGIAFLYLVFEQICGRTCTAVLWFAKDARKVDKYDFKDRWKNAWYEYDSEWGHYTVNSVTHWMPLPEPPKGD